MGKSLPVTSSITRYWDAEQSSAVPPHPGNHQKRYREAGGNRNIRRRHSRFRTFSNFTRLRLAGRRRRDSRRRGRRPGGRRPTIDLEPYRTRDELTTRVSTVDRPGTTGAGPTEPPVISSLSSSDSSNWVFFPFYGSIVPFFFFFQLLSWSGPVYVVLIVWRWVRGEGILLCFFYCVVSEVVSK